MTTAYPSGDPAATSADAHYFQRLSEGVFEIPSAATAAGITSFRASFAPIAAP
jgi:hypothetical protein